NPFPGGEVSIFLGNGDGTFAFDNNSIVATGLSPTGVVVADFNGDGEPDLALSIVNVDFSQICYTCTTVNGNIALFLGAGQATFGANPISTRVGAAKSIPNAVQAVDLNGDGKLDLAFVNTGQPGSAIDDTVSVLLGNGDGTFQSEHHYAAG